MDIILTGIARSGTTLSCSLLNRLPQCIALHEPMNPADLVGLPYPDAYLERIGAFFKDQRSSLLRSGIAVSKGRDGIVPDNPFGTALAATGLRASIVRTRTVRFDKALSRDFRLVVKHPNMFTATLPALSTRYPCYAIVRNPLAVLLSWNSIEAPVNEGRLPFGEAFDPELKSHLAAEPDRLSRQLIIIRWYFSRYTHLLPRNQVIRYEDLISSGGRALAVMDPGALALSEPLENRNKNHLYDHSLVQALADRLLGEESIYGIFYSRSDVERLCAEWTRGMSGGPAIRKPSVDASASRGTIRKWQGWMQVTLSNVGQRIRKAGRRSGTP
jgi:ribosome-associated protein YbcJ (S4-like RNA binding protein)